MHTLSRKVIVALAGVLALFLVGCTSGPPIKHTYTAIGQDSRVQYLIIHYTAQSFELAIQTLTKGEASSHYLVRDFPPKIYQLVDEDRRAWHAGKSFWKGQTSLNAASLGIENVNCGFDKFPDGSAVFSGYPDEQIDRLIELMKPIVKRHKISPDRILAHSDINPQQKSDPGPTFPWRRLAAEGLINWPDESLIDWKRAQYERSVPDIAWFQKKLAVHGYEVPSTGVLDPKTRRVITVFQMKYRPENWSGDPDAETAAILYLMTSVIDGE